MILLGGYFYFRYEENIIRNEKYENLKAITELKISQITQWHKERLGDANAVYRNSFFEKGVEQFLYNGHNSELENDIPEQLSNTKTNYGYENIFITSPTGELVFSIDPTLKTGDSDTKRFISEAAIQQKVTFTDLYYCLQHRKIHYDIIVPVINRNDISIATLIFRVDPNEYLYPLIQSWPTTSKSTEILIVRKNDDSVLFLNKLRFRANVAMKFQLSLALKTNPAVRAVNGYEGIVEGKDYRGIDVLAYICKVPGTPWLMVAKVDRAEIFSELHYRSVLIIFVTIILIILTAVSISRFHYNRQRNIYRELFQKEKVLTEIMEEYRTTLNSITDGVIATDTSGMIRNMNPVAEKLTRWKETDAKGKILREVIRIVNKKSNLGIDIPIDQVINDGIIVALDRESLLISKTGNETPITGNCAPIIHKDKEITGVVIVIRDQTVEWEANKKLVNSDMRYRRLFETTRDGIMFLDATNGVIIDVNPFMIEMLGYTHDQFLGKHLWDLGFFRNVVENKDKFFELQEKEYVRYENISFETADGRRIEIEFISNTYMVGKRKVVQCNILNITDRKQAEQILKQTNIDLERSNKELEQFAHVASHDLQEPLRMISSFSQLLSKRYKNQLGKDADEFIHYIVDGANRMQNLIQDLLSFSRVSSRGDSFNLADSRLAMEEAIANLHVSIKESGAIITNDDLPVILADYIQIVQVFQNLIGNAIKFHGEESPRIHISATPEDGEWLFSVKDNGIGIEAQYFTRIFIIFQRLHTRAQYPGTGIGLAICNRIIHRHEGRIWVESEPGKGSVFYFTIKM